MALQSHAWKRAAAAVRFSAVKTGKRWKTASATARADGDSQAKPTTASGRPKPLDLSSLYGSISHDENQKRSQEREFLVSVLASSPTKRDTKHYLQTFGRTSTKTSTNPQKTQTSELTKPAALEPSAAASYPSSDGGIRAVAESPQFIQGPRANESTPVDAGPHVAIIKFRDPQSVDDFTLGEVAKTLVQLKALGLLGIVVVDCELSGSVQNKWLDLVTHQTLRIAGAVDIYGEPVCAVVDSALTVGPDVENGSSPFVSRSLYVGDEEVLMRRLRQGDLVLIPPYTVSTEQCEAKLLNTNDIILALTRYFSGLQFPKADTVSFPANANDNAQPARNAIVDRVIVLDALGGIPSTHRPNGAHVFLNMEEEYELAKADIDNVTKSLGPLGGTANAATEGLGELTKKRHRENLDLARNTLAILPPTASALLTTPAEAANLVSPEHDSLDDTGFVGSVGTRRSQNPLIHNLLTDRPVYSSSLPLGRIRHKSTEPDAAPAPLSRTTLVKRGMPVTIFPDPRVEPWVPPRKGMPRIRLTDTCIDLPRLVYLIEDSFNRKLDVQHYLDRVNESLAGVIIAGEYEGGAILTWERPSSLDEETAYNTGRLVPYLDKFAVLKKSQGAGGVADIVFNAMVRDCFPEGVCWRSRKGNPVNKWYFERSSGAWKLDNSNWTMFWTTPWEAGGENKLWDYEDVCRNVVPSWADKKHIAD